MILHSCSGPGCYACKLKTLQLQPTTAFQPHYNFTVGTYVSTDAQFRDELKRCADRNSESTGLYHDYQPRYPGDTQPIREADQSLDDQAREIRRVTDV